MAVKCSEDIIPLTDLKTNLGGVVRSVADSPRPGLLTGRGRGAAVVPSVAQYEAAEGEREFMRAVVRGIADVEAGREVSIEEVRGSARLFVTEWPPALRVKGIGQQQVVDGQGSRHERQVQVAERVGKECGRRPAILGLVRSRKRAGKSRAATRTGAASGSAAAGSRSNAAASSAAAPPRPRPTRASGASARSDATARTNSASALVCTREQAVADRARQVGQDPVHAAPAGGRGRSTLAGIDGPSAMTASASR